MSALGTPVLINPNRAYWLSSIANDVIHSTIQTQEIDAGIARFSTVYVSDFLTTSTLNASSFTLTNLDLSEANISTLYTNSAYTSTLYWASGDASGTGQVKITTDPSGVSVDGDPIKFNNLVYFTSTITIVPVSTVVDQDIFAQRGFFSTLSSGSISTGNLKATNGSISTLTVSTLTAGDISGFSPSDWSLYPTLNSSITFQPGFVLSNINNKLYFAGYELTDVSGGGNNWSAFPALQDVSMNNFSLRALSTLQYQDGARLYSLTGNNLFYNGQQISYGQAGAASNWSLYPALQTVNMNGQGIGTTGNLNIVATSNINNIASDFTVTADQGLNLATAADITLTAQNGLKGRINMTANGGNNNGIFGEINMVANGATLGGVGTGGLITLTANTPLGTASNLTSAVKLSASGINSYAGAVPPIGSLAGYNFIYGTGGVNICTGLPPALPNIPFTTYLYGSAGVTTSSDFYVPTIQPYFNGLTTPPDLVIQGRFIIPNAAQVYVQLSNIKTINMDAGASITNLRTLNMSNGTGVITDVSTINGVPFAQVLTQSNIVCSNLTATVSVNTAVVNTQSTITNSIFNNYSQISTLLYGQGIGVSSVIGALRVNNIQIADNLTGVTNAPNPNQSRLLNFSTVNSFNMSTTDLWVSSINGQAPGGGGGSVTNIFSTLFTSSFKTSTMSGYVLAGAVPFSTIVVEGGIQFTGDYQGDPLSGRFLSSVRNINSYGEPLEIFGGGSNKEFSLFYPSQLGGNTKYVRIGEGGAFDTKIRNLNGWGAVSTTVVMASTLMGPTATALDVSGSLSVRGEVVIPSNNILNFSGGTVLGNNLLINSNMPCFTSGSVFGCNLGAVAANQFLIGSGTGAFGAAKLYCDFPGDNWGVDIIDANGSTLFETLNCYDTAGFNFQTNIYGVSSIVGFTANTPGAQQAVGIQGIVTAPMVSTTFLQYTSTLQYYQSNTSYNIPIRLEHDAAGNTSTSGAAIQIIGHSLQNGAAVHMLEMGWRSSDAANYIAAVWPGQNLEDLSIEGEPVKITDGIVSTIFNTQPFAMQTTGGVSFGPTGQECVISTGTISTPALLVSSINGNDARPAYTNNLCLSTMDLYAASTTLLHWSTVTTSSNINTSDYDVVVGLNGTFKIGVSLQMNNRSGSDTLEFAFFKNDAPINYTATIETIPNNELTTAYAEILEPLVNGDKIQIGCYTASSDLICSTVQGNLAISPGAILTVYKVD